MFLMLQEEEVVAGLTEVVTSAVAELKQNDLSALQTALTALTKGTTSDSYSDSDPHEPGTTTAVPSDSLFNLIYDQSTPLTSLSSSLSLPALSQSTSRRPSGLWPARRS